MQTSYHITDLITERVFMNFFSIGKMYQIDRVNRYINIEKVLIIIKRVNYPFIHYFDVTANMTITYLNINNLKAIYVFYIKTLPKTEFNTLRLLYE